MGLKHESDHRYQIPFIDFGKNSEDLKEGSDLWKRLCEEVREACEVFGCFQVAYHDVPGGLRGEMFMGLKELFDLPDETKEKNKSSKPYYGYLSKSEVVPLYESLGIADAPTLDGARAFTNLLWPDGGNPPFCQTLNSMSKKMVELELLIRKMLFKSYGVTKYYEANVENSEYILRVMKYAAPPSHDAVIGLTPHTDKGILTILCPDDQVQGLEVLSDQGDWVGVVPAKGTFIVFVGEALKAWSNGRLRAAKHRVVMSGNKQRYSFALFATPKEGTIVEVPLELVDQDHPLLFRPFNFMDFLYYFYANHTIENALEIYAGV